MEQQLTANVTPFDKTIVVTKLSITAPKIEMISQDGQTLASASGTFYRHNNNLFIVTNWHNLSGINPSTGEYMSSFRQAPVTVRVIGRRMRDEIINVPHVFDIPLRRLEDQSLVWSEHPTFGRKVDIAAIAIPAEHAGGLVPCNADLCDSPVVKCPGDEVFVLGYPRGLSGGLHYPLWKRGSIASEPSQDIDGLPMYLIDTAGREGMSGAPVYFRSHAYLTEGNQFVVGKTAQIFYGIYSGRIGEKSDSRIDPIAAQIGLVWKPKAIAEVVSSGITPII